jgi:hypothetical protein
MINIQEDNKSILDLIQYVDTKIIGIIKQKKLSQAALQDLQNLYEGAINDWMAFFPFLFYIPLKNKLW